MNLDLAYRSILDCMEEAVCVLDMQSNIIFMNPAAEEIAERRGAKPLGKPFNEVFCADVAETKGNCSHKSCRSIDGELEITTSPLYEDGRPAGSIVFLKKASQSSDNDESASFEDGVDAEGNLAAHIGENIDAEETRKDSFLKGIALAANLLLTNKDDDSIINQALELLGYSTEVDSVYILENYEGDGEHFHRLRYEWSREENRATLGNSEAYSNSYSAFPGWYEALSRGLPIKGLTRNLPEVARDFLSKRGIRSFLIVPLFMGEHLWGFMGF